ncbi:EAL domain-containing protein [soil metagenome]
MSVETGLVRASTATVLIVDDNAAKRLSIASVLGPLGHTLVEAASGEQALHEVMKQNFAVILMDVHMPIMGGYETANLIRMRVQSEHTPIIFITASIDDEAEVPIAYASGAVDFIFGKIVASTLQAKVSIFAELHLKSQELEDSLTEVTMLSERFRDSEARTRSVLDHVADGIITISEAGVIESFNRAACRLFGYAEDEAVGRFFSELIADTPPTEPGTFESLMAVDRSTRPAESIGRRKDQTTFPMEIALSDVRLGDRTVLIGCVRDNSERQQHTENLHYQALHDHLTDLPNRVLFTDRVEQAIRSSRTSDEPSALLVMDLDHFKHINDTLGHLVGDRLLIQVAERLVACLDRGDTVARLGGDEFGILPLGPMTIDAATTVADRIVAALATSFDVDGHVVEIDASVGITLVPDHGDAVSDLLRRADLAMYQAKRTGGGSAVFTAELEDAPARRLALLNELRQCVQRDELVLHYQPKIDLSTKETVGLEALIRWNHPSGRLLAPAEFMPEVEESDLMVPITEWVINEALSQLKAWRDLGYDLTMAVNIGARCLANGSGLFEAVDQMTTAWGVPANKLTFELTEIALIDTTVPGLLDHLENMGERLSIDDFGTGYSSLVYLQRLPVVEIKADRSFVSSMATVSDDAVIVRSTIDLAHNLSASVVAEGVEDEATMNMLIEYGCDHAQGFHFSKPATGPDLTTWFATSPYGLPARLG